VLAQRFTELVGEAPMRYLANWRMQLATRVQARDWFSASDVAQRCPQRMRNHPDLKPVRPTQLGKRCRRDALDLRCEIAPRPYRRAAMTSNLRGVARRTNPTVNRRGTGEHRFRVVDPPGCRRCTRS
jgi:hypothetical protein